ncbi:hypothetical protein [Streptomyces sp. NPDC001933]|uniref:hypothetical protein n=1 Tax=Streptomyces sp. NPDC001933 TaxID=3364626 RepID=UPI0036BFC547
MKRRTPVAAWASAFAAIAVVLVAGASNAASAQTSLATQEQSVAAKPFSTKSKCGYHSYDGWGPGEAVTHKGAGGKGDGITKRYGRSLQLATGRIYDRSAAKLTNARKGDKVWVDISHSKGKNWKACGTKSLKKGEWSVTSKIYQHSSSQVKGRYMRACAKTDGKVWCAWYGNKVNDNHSDHKTRYWWTDS